MSFQTVTAIYMKVFSADRKAGMPEKAAAAMIVR